jgi:hypothetical protein
MEPESVEFFGTHQRLRIGIYSDGTARLCYKPLLWRKIHGGRNTNAWRFVGDFTPEQARHIAKLFFHVVDFHSDAKNMRAPCHE